VWKNLFALDAPAAAMDHVRLAKLFARYPALITEGFHRKMKLIQRRAYGFKNFNNYRLRVIAQCG